MKGETVDEITGSASAMHSVANTISPRVNPHLLDIVGTGGDGANTLNISTAAAFVIAGAGYPVAKHGNRAVSSKCGSADVLEALGVDLSLEPEQVKTCIEEVGIGFMFAPLFHPAMKYAIGPRRELGQRTIFNILGPLTNPAKATHQLIGVYDASLTETMANVLDELTTNGTNKVSELRQGKVKTYEFDPHDLGLRPAELEDLKGGSAEDNADTLRDVLGGRSNGPFRDVVLLNAAGAIGTILGDLEASLIKARESLESGAALAKLEALVSTSQRLANAA
jgi:anthranilate phosphoribosyltransferase